MVTVKVITARPKNEKIKQKQTTKVSLAYFYLFKNIVDIFNTTIPS